jgi:hypothetical protein
MNQKDTATKLRTVTTELLRKHGYISFEDVFMKLGYLEPRDYENWRRQRIPYLEKVIKVNLSKINFIMKYVRKTSHLANLRESWTDYRSWGKGPKVRLQFSKGGEENIERAYATRFLMKKEKRTLHSRKKENLKKEPKNSTQHTS